MLQQTPVARVVPAYDAWLHRWPAPVALAADEPGDAVRMWGRLGYPRRALRLHAAAMVISERHGGQVPTRLPELLALPGVGDYTARAVAVFAHRQRHPVVDTNVRRVIARLVEGVADAAVTKRDLALMQALLPADTEAAAVTSVALMELGALVCTHRAPTCPRCPLAARCSWLGRGRPALEHPVRKPQGYAGTDRQVRGRLLAALREADGPVPVTALELTGADRAQQVRALAGLIADGLVQRLPGGRMALPTRAAGPGR